MYNYFILVDKDGIQWFYCTIYEHVEDSYLKDKIIGVKLKSWKLHEAF